MKIGVAINSHNPNLEWLKQAVDSAVGFDEVRLYVQGVSSEQAGVIAGWEVPNLSVEFGKNILGVVEGFNHVIGQMESDWICPFCDDDFFHAGNLGDVLSEIRQGLCNGYDVVHSRVFVNSERETWGSSEVTEGALLQGNCLPFSSIYTKEIFERVGGYKIEPLSDWDFWLRVAKKGGKFKYFQQPIYTFRFGHDSSQQRQMEKYGGMGKIREMILRSHAEA